VESTPPLHIVLPLQMDWLDLAFLAVNELAVWEIKEFPHPGIDVQLQMNPFPVWLEVDCVVLQ